jgi:hypothetical protein
MSTAHVVSMSTEVAPVAPIPNPEDKNVVAAKSMAAPMATESKAAPTESMAAPTAAEPPKVVPAPVVEAAVVPDADAMPTTAPQDETKPEPKAVPKGGILGKILSSFKGDRKPKAPKSPKKDAKKEMKEEAEVMPEAPVAMEAAATEPATNAEMPKQEEVTKSAQATENPVAAVAKEGEEVAAPTEMAAPTAPKESAPKTTSKLARRLSHGVADFFRGKPKADVPVSPKVDELPPMIEQPQSVAPLENPATPVVEAKVEGPVEAATPAVAATA